MQKRAATGTASVEGGYKNMSPLIKRHYTVNRAHAKIVIDIDIPFFKKIKDRFANTIF